MATTATGVGAHQSHLGPSSWHKEVTCEQCHLVPTSMGDPGHMDTSLPAEVTWDPTDLANADGATPTWNGTTCNGVYCHGGTIAGSGKNDTPNWTTVDGSQAECGTSCHTLPPGGAHPNDTGCPTCHGAVISSFTAGAPPTVTWTDASLHIDGKLDVVGGSLNCTSCHGNPATNDPMPPKGTQGETLTTQAAVGAHVQHVAASTWHRQVACSDCHTLPTSTSHANGVVDFTWSAVAKADGASLSYSAATVTCTGAYCHGGTLAGPKPGGSTKTAPVWTTVNGSFDACGTSCHTNPPGPTHPTATDCSMCHSAVVQSFNPTTNATVWKAASLHVNGTVETSAYHDLAGWTSPQGGANHHGSNYFLTNQQKDEHDRACTECHGANLNGGVVGVSCNNTTCHKGQSFTSCTFCHGTPPSQNNPPVGVSGETTTSTLAVGRHVAHLTASSSHVAFACSTCHAVPASGNLSHALQYVPSANLSTAGHHGDVSFSGPGAGMTFNVNATTGAPVAARGTCIGACHSNGNGGPPNVTPYWAGGNWNAGGCGNCHNATPNTGRHNKHVNGENLGCNVCHPPASSSTHLNGTEDLLPTISGPQGGGVTTYPPGVVCTNRWACSGNCHGKNHNNLCWNN